MSVLTAHVPSILFSSLSNPILPNSSQNQTHWQPFFWHHFPLLHAHVMSDSWETHYFSRSSESKQGWLCHCGDFKVCPQIHWYSFHPKAGPNSLPLQYGLDLWLPSNRIKQKLQGAIFSAGLWQLLLLLSLASLAEKSQLLRHGDTVAESRVPCGEELRPPVGSPMSEPGSRPSSPCQARW